MPFRVILRRGGVEHPVGYSLLLAALSMIICMLAAVTISVKASNRAIREAERGQCETIQADVDAYRVEPPTTKAGKRQMAAKEARLKTLGCPKPEDK